MPNAEDCVQRDAYMNDIPQPTLPPWFASPQPTTRWRQLTLFRSPFADALVRLRISADECARWHANRWLSFDGSRITEVDDFDDPRVWELIVVRDVVRSGLSDAQIVSLLSQLPKPFAVDPDRVAYSFRHGWVEATIPAEPDPDTIIEEHLDSWLETCDQERLQQFYQKIGELLAGSGNAHTENTE